MRSEINLLKHENSVLKAKGEGSDSPAGGVKARAKEEKGTVKLRQKIAQLEMQLKQKVGQRTAVMSNYNSNNCSDCSIIICLKSLQRLSSNHHHRIPRSIQSRSCCKPIARTTQALRGQ